MGGRRLLSLIFLAARTWMATTESAFEEVLILSQGRSGGSFLSELVTKGYRVAYLHEPCRSLQLKHTVIGGLSRAACAGLVNRLLDCSPTEEDLDTFTHDWQAMERSEEWVASLRARSKYSGRSLKSLRDLFLPACRASVRVVKEARLALSLTGKTGGNSSGKAAQSGSGTGDDGMLEAEVTLMQRPGLAIIHLVRDARAVVVSRLGVAAYCGRQPAPTCAVEVCKHADALHTMTRAVAASGRLKLLRLEDLAANPATEGQGVYTWLGWGTIPPETSQWIEKAVAAGPGRADSDAVIGSDRRRLLNRRLLVKSRLDESDTPKDGPFGSGGLFDPMAHALGSAEGSVSKEGHKGGDKKGKKSTPYVDVRVADAQTKLYDMESVMDVSINRAESNGTSLTFASAKWKAALTTNSVQKVTTICEDSLRRHGYEVTPFLPKPQPIDPRAAAHPVLPWGNTAVTSNTRGRISPDETATTVTSHVAVSLRPHGSAPLNVSPFFSRSSSGSSSFSSPFMSGLGDITTLDSSEVTGPSEARQEKPAPPHASLSAWREEATETKAETDRSAGSGVATGKWAAAQKRNAFLKEQRLALRPPPPPPPPPRPKGPPPKGDTLLQQDKQKRVELKAIKAKESKRGGGETTGVASHVAAMMRGGRVPGTKEAWSHPKDTVFATREARATAAALGDLPFWSGSDRPPEPGLGKADWKKRRPIDRDRAKEFVFVRGRLLTPLQSKGGDATGTAAAAAAAVDGAAASEPRCPWDKAKKMRVCDPSAHGGKGMAPGGAQGKAQGSSSESGHASVQGWRPHAGKALDSRGTLAAAAAAAKVEARGVREAMAAAKAEEAAAAASEVTSRCGRTLQPDGASVLPPLTFKEGMASHEDYLHHSLAGKEAALEWWNCTVLGAMLASPPSVGRATLLFIHVPKAGGLSVSRVFDSLVDARSPLCGRRFANDLRGKPVALQHAPAPHAAYALRSTASDAASDVASEEDYCARANSNLVWGQVSLDLRGAAQVSAPREGGRRQLTHRQLLGKQKAAAADGAGFPRQYPERRAAWAPVRVYSFIILRDPFERLVSLANFVGVSQAEFEGSWGKQLASNTMTSMVNGLGPMGTLNRNRFPSDHHSCVNNPTAAIAEATRRLAQTFTVVGVTSHFPATLWLAQRAFGWGEAVIMPSLLHPQRGFRTKIAEVRHVPPFAASLVDETVKDALLKIEHCDDAAHAFAEALVKSRLEAMGEADAKAYRAFGQTLNRALKWQAKAGEERGSDGQLILKAHGKVKDLSGIAAKHYKPYEV